MFGFGRTTEAHPSPSIVAVAQYAPGTEISYDADLVAHFKGHHGALVALAGKARASAEAGDFAHVATYIRKFKLLLNEHLLEENLRLYTYLTYCLKGNDEGSESMAAMRGEMGDIGRGVSRFLRHYEEHGVDERNVAKFMTEFDQIVATLGDRIEREERSLYTMYMPPSHLLATQ